MQLSGLHLLLTYQCTYECDHCFVWGSPWQEGTLTLRQIENILRQAHELGSVRWIYYEGGEPFLYAAVLLKAARLAVEHGFRVGVVSNGYWATDVQDALECLQPFTGLIADLSISSDTHHGEGQNQEKARYAVAAAKQLGIPTGTITIDQPGTAERCSDGQLPHGVSEVMFRGRAAEKLAIQVPQHSWSEFRQCPHEDFLDLQRVHIDPLGYVHVCQGISIGNVFQMSLKEICARYDPTSHPIVAPLVAKGPAEIARRYAAPHADAYADACHLCYEVRSNLRWRFPEILAPDPMYGVLCE